MSRFSAKSHNSVRTSQSVGVDGQILRGLSAISFFKVVCSSVLLFLGMLVGYTVQALDAIPEVAPAKQGVSATQLAALDALACVRPR